MRTIPYKEVFDRVVGLLGRDPQAEIKPDMARTIVKRINQRARYICELWRWPQWELTEERAFRQVWNDTHQYLRANFIDGTPDEVFYIPDMTYYRVNPDFGTDPQIGIAPPDAPFPSSGSGQWEVIDPVDTFISYDQVCKRAIGMVLGVYTRNPRVPTGSNCGGLQFQPSERGIDVINAGNPTVFVRYKMPIPRYTIIPYVPGKIFQKGKITFDPTVGECFQALVDTNVVPSDMSQWRRVPFPEEWEGFVATRAYSDCLLELDGGAAGPDAQIKLLLYQQLKDEANDLFQAEVDVLTAQGQQLKYEFCRVNGHCCESIPWSGGTVTTLTDACEDEFGWIYPSPMDQPMVSWRFYNEIIQVDGIALSLVSIETRLLESGSIAEFILGPSGARERHTWQLLSGAGNMTDPGQRQPLDYDAANNNKHWERTSG